MLEAVVSGIFDDGLVLGWVAFEEELTVWSEMVWSFSDDLFDEAQAMVWCEEGNIGLVSEGFAIEPRPVAVNIGRVGENKIEAPCDVLKKVGLDEAEVRRVEICRVLSSGVEG